MPVTWVELRYFFNIYMRIFLIKKIQTNYILYVWVVNYINRKILCLAITGFQTNFKEINIVCHAFFLFFFPSVTCQAVQACKIASKIAATLASSPI